MASGTVHGTQTLWWGCMHSLCELEKRCDKPTAPTDASQRSSTARHGAIALIQDINEVGRKISHCPMTTIVCNPAAAAAAALCLQLADDFALFADARPRPGIEREPDELNLVYVALSRAMLGLVCNRDLAELVTAESRKRLVVEVRKYCVLTSCHQQSRVAMTAWLQLAALRMSCDVWHRTLLRRQACKGLALFFTR
jgi:hypothetical protein